MIRFRGSFLHTIDNKGRLSVPNRFRDALKSNGDDRLVLTKGSNGCLSAYPMERWLEIEEEVDRLPAGEEKDHFIRHFISPAQDCNVDRMGRVLVPQQLREVAGLDREVMIAGALSKFEIWDLGRWEAYMKASEPKAHDLLKVDSIRL
ncbi:MAG: division/cell wall cluster transcriptional repressor MraZ [Pseudomonadota bacterium]